MSDYFEITTSGNIFAKVSAELRTRIRTYGDLYARTVAEIFVEHAKQKLAAAYPNTGRLTENIFFQRSVGYGNYRIGVKNNDEKEVMFYLEFGTGIVGRNNPHPDADEFAWFYVEDPREIRWNYDQYGYKYKDPNSGSWVYKDGQPYGWYYYDNELGEVRFTRGLKAVRYIYDTYLEIDDIKKEAERRLKNGK